MLETSMGMFIKKTLPSTKPDRRIFDVGYAYLPKRERKPVFEFGTLQTCRREFEKAMRQDIDWPTEPTAWVAEPSRADELHELVIEGSGSKVVSFRNRCELPK